MQSFCPDVEYKVTAVNCGVCPSATNNTNISCVLDDESATVDNLCFVSVQTVVCSFTGENRSTVTVLLKGMYYVDIPKPCINIII